MAAGTKSGRGKLTIPPTGLKKRRQTRDEAQGLSAKVGASSVGWKWGEAVRYPEQEIHRAVVSHLNWRAMPGVFFFHPPNGGYRSKVEGAIFKGLGVKRGVPDLIIFYSGQIFGLEFKSTKGRVSPVQRQVMNDMEVAGARTSVAASIDEALVTLECWGVIRREYHRVPDTTKEPTESA